MTHPMELAMGLNIQTIDWSILIGLFLCLLALAVWINSRCKTVADYLVSGRKVRIWLGMGAGIAGEIGLISIVAMCEQGYKRGFGFVLIAILTMFIMVPLFGIFGFGIERFRASKAMSVPQYIEMRYDKRLRIMTGLFNSFAGVLQMCVFPIVGAGFVRVLIGAPEYAFNLGDLAVKTDWIIMGILLSCACLFTFLGGYITLIVTNFFQMIIIMGSLYWLGFELIREIGVQELWSSLESQHGLSAVYPFAGQEGGYSWIWFFWSVLMGILLQFSYGPYLQKYAAMDKPRTASLSYLVGSLFGNGRTFVIMGLGVAALAMMGTGKPVGLEVSDTLWGSMATPYFLSQHVKPVMMGLLLASLLFSDISTTDQYILSWSTSIVNDCICPFKKKPFSPRAHIMAVRITIMILCVLFFLFGLVYSPTMPIWEFLWSCATVICGTGIAMLFGMYWKRASVAGAYAAVLTCLILPVTDLAARQVWMFTGHEPDKYFWRPETGAFTVFVIAIGLMVALSLLSNKPTKYWDLGQAVRDMNKGKVS
jgi:solute:Na+ symporter, SSS family